MELKRKKVDKAIIAVIIVLLFTTIIFYMIDSFGWVMIFLILNGYLIYKTYQDYNEYKSDQVLVFIDSQGIKFVKEDIYIPLICITHITKRNHHPSTLSNSNSQLKIDYKFGNETHSTIMVNRYQFSIDDIYAFIQEQG